MKYVILLIAILLAITSATALEMCDNTPEINTNCTMVTPYIECGTYNYTIFNLTYQVSSGNLTLLDSGIYYFNFTEGEGDYIVKLCDGSTREVYVRQEDENKMIIAITILLPLILGIILTIVAAQFGDKHNILRIALLFFALFTFIASAHIATESIIKFYNFPEIQSTIATYVWILISTLIIMLVYFLAQGLIYIKEKKLQEAENIGRQL